MLDREQKLELIQRTLGIRHKLKVHESMKAPETHEEMARILSGKWELEDELRAIEELLVEARNANVAAKKASILKTGTVKSKPMVLNAKDANAVSAMNGNGSASRASSKRK